MEQRQHKRCREIFTAIFVFVLIMSCVKKTDKSKSASGDGEIGGNLVFTTWDSNQTPGMQANIDLFTKMHPNASVDLQVTPWGEYWLKLRTAASANNLPDLFWMHFVEFDLFASSDALVDLTDRIAADSAVSMNNYPKDLVDVFQHKGRQYAIPKDYGIVGLWYNKALFDQGGLPYPDDQWTWNDLVDAAKKLTDTEKGIYGFLADNNIEEGWGNFVYQNGGALVRPNGKSGWDMPETIGAMQRWIDFSLKDGSSPPIVEADNQLFLSGKVAMRQMGSWMVSTMIGSDYAKANMNMTVLPKGKKRAVSYNGLGYVIGANTKNLETAWAFTKVLASEEGQRLQGENSAAIPAFNGTFDSWANSFQSDYNLKAYESQLPYAFSFKRFPGQQEAGEPTSVTMGKIFGGTVPVEEGLKKLAKQINQIIDENR